MQHTEEKVEVYKMIKGKLNNYCFKNKLVLKSQMCRSIPGTKYISNVARPMWIY